MSPLSGLHHPFEPLLFVQQLISEKVNFTLAVPAVVVAILKHPATAQIDLSSLRYFAQGAAHHLHGQLSGLLFLHLHQKSLKPLIR
ncbi:MAG: hypothetical protein QW738_08935 [Nitrososphaeria archaeon]